MPSSRTILSKKESSSKDADDQLSSALQSPRRSSRAHLGKTALELLGLSHTKRDYLSSVVGNQSVSSTEFCTSKHEEPIPMALPAEIVFKEVGESAASVKNMPPNQKFLDALDKSEECDSSQSVDDNLESSPKVDLDFSKVIQKEGESKAIILVGDDIIKSGLQSDTTDNTAIVSCQQRFVDENKAVVTSCDTDSVLSAGLACVGDRGHEKACEIPAETREALSELRDRNGDTIVVIEQDGDTDSTPIIVRITADGEVKDDVGTMQAQEALAILAQQGREDDDVQPINRVEKTKPVLQSSSDHSLPEDPMSLPDDQGVRYAFLANRLVSYTAAVGSCTPVTDRDLDKLSQHKERSKAMPHVVATAELQSYVENIGAKADLSEHLITSQGERGKQLHCMHCFEKIDHRHHFRRHMRNNHREINFRPFKCPLCDYSADVKAGLARHINIHTNTKPYICTICGRGFTFQQKLKLHMKYHRDQRDQVCAICGMGFHEHRTLRNHIQKIHNISNPTEFIKEHSKPDEGGDVSESTVEGACMTQASHQPMILCEAEEMEAVEVVDVEIMQGDNVIKLVAAGSAGVSETSSESWKSQKNVDGEGDVSEHTDEMSQKTIAASSLDRVDSSCILTKHDGVVEHSKDYSPAVGLGEDHLVEDLTGENITSNQPIKQPVTIYHMNKRSQIKGAKKTELQAKRFSEFGLTPQDLKKAFGSFPSAGRKRPEAPAPEPKQRKGKYSRVQRAEDMDPELVNYCSVVGQGKDITFTCTLCVDMPMVFTCKSKFASHIEKGHPDLKAWHCHTCSFTCRLRTSLITHEKIHSGQRIHKCSQCDKAFLHKQKLNAHIRRFHLNKRDFPCPLCPKAFNETNDVTKHIQRVHIGARPWMCTVCGKAYKDKAALTNHMDTHGPSKRYQCQYCLKFYATRLSLVQHMKSHTCLFHCEICDRNFGSYSGFMAHKVMHDESFEGYKCDMCSATLHTKSSLKRHKTLVHSDVRHFLCSLCKSTFKTRRDLKCHELSHTTEKPFHCDLCDFACKRMETLKVHKRRHAADKPFACTSCGKQYTQKQSLDNHQSKHCEKGSGCYHCPICDKDFNSKYMLCQHNNKFHEGELSGNSGEPVSESTDSSLTVFMCEECNSVFLTQDYLASHILAAHMKHSYMKPLNENGTEAPETQVEVSTASSEPAQLSYLGEQVERGLFEGQQAVESQVEIASTDDLQSGKMVTLIHPAETENDSSAAAVLATPPEEESQMEAVPMEGLDMKEVVERVGVYSEKEAADKTSKNADGNEDNTMLTITDPSNNESYVVSVPSATLQQLLSSSSNMAEVVQKIAAIQLSRGAVSGSSEQLGFDGGETEKIQPDQDAGISESESLVESGLNDNY